MTLLRQVFALTLSGLRSIPQRIGATSVTVVGVLIVVSVLSSMLAVGEGLQTWSAANARSDRVVILSEGAEFAAQSSLSRDALARVASLPGVKQGEDGKPLLTGRFLASVEVAQPGVEAPVVLAARVRQRVLPHVVDDAADPE